MKAEDIKKCLKKYCVIYYKNGFGDIIDFDCTIQEVTDTKSSVLCPNKNEVLKKEIWNKDIVTIELM